MSPMAIPKSERARATCKLGLGKCAAVEYGLDDRFLLCCTERESSEHAGDGVGLNRLAETLRVLRLFGLADGLEVTSLSLADRHAAKASSCPPPASLQAVRDHPVRQVVRGQGHGHAVTEDDADAVLAHAATELGTHFGTGIGLHFKLPAGVDVGDYAIELYMIIATQTGLLVQAAPGRLRACIDSGFSGGFQSATPQKRLVLLTIVGVRVSSRA
jgi:hypothetical protein